MWAREAWGAGAWGKPTRNPDTFFLHSAKGDKISFKIEATNRFRFNGYITKYRDTGAL